MENTHIEPPKTGGTSNSDTFIASVPEATFTTSASVEPPKPSVQQTQSAPANPNVTRVNNPPRKSSSNLR